MINFKYRGAEYNLEPTSPPEPIEGDRTAQFRGQSYTIPETETPAVPQPVMGLTYRGVAYQTTPSGGTVLSRETVPHAKAVPTPIHVQSPSVVRHRQDGLAEFQRRTLLQGLRNRLRIAKAKGDRLLVAQLEQELQLLAQ